jgi:hypothetical protein
VVDNSPQSLAAPNQVRRRKLTLEDRELEVVSKPAHQLEDLPQPLIVANVITD